ncbi:DUF1572 domain-containing protein [Flavobacterium selenitireducens]|uniref:DUF1572 domain-containing protein n=1 Tax=Flavobacterium selenitireducens TaxID=2722704 RepID=UPI00168BF42F|nr:DUF1572 domain-containing protein [Flavobacterium selenitireducens]MBD3581310.1 DUF1572 domain-containing protein [Flavobacterium selenitireducens]
MSKNLAITNRLREVLLDGYWVANTNFKAQILSVTWEQATQKIGNLNTIAALTFHINYYIRGVSDVFDGHELTISDKYSFDAPQIQSAEDWKNLVDCFINNAEKFVNQVERLPDTMLGKIFVDAKYGDYLRNIEGIIEHSYYHLGQISLIKKMLSDL